MSEEKKEEKKIDKKALLTDFEALSVEDQRTVAAEIARLLLSRGEWTWLAQVMTNLGCCGPVPYPCWPRGGWRWCCGW